MAKTDEYSNLIISNLKKNEDGLTNADIKTMLPNLNPNDVVKIINKLIAKKTIRLFTRGNEVIYKLETEKPSTLQGAENEDMVVYEIIKDAGNKGIWVRDIRTKSNLNHVILNKTLKILENRKCIKSVKTVLAGKKKVYMLYDLEPDSSLTGGAWYTDQDFESEFVDVLNKQIYRYLCRKRDKFRNIQGGPLAQNNMSYASVKEILKFITELNISRIELSEKDIVCILNTLIYDDKIMSKESPDGSILYKAVNPMCMPAGINYTPCGACQIFKKCHADCRVNPATCEYLSSWLNSS